ncbi:hypothetical protein GGI42DRAFT_358916 [Trichoderma sp. SZMC 28013]
MPLRRRPKGARNLITLLFQAVPCSLTPGTNQITSSQWRLLWVDGWQGPTTVAEKPIPKQPMTLIVLKLSLHTFDQDLKVETVKATLQFKDVDWQCGDDPEVQAWAPFHDLDDWNPTEAENKSTRNVNATASGGYAGASLSIGWSKSREISWNQTAFDEGRSILVKSKLKQRPISVVWSLEQNKLQKLGVPPVIWAARLIKRKTDSEYLVKFRLDYQRSAPRARGTEADTAETVATARGIIVAETRQTQACVEAEVETG